MNFVDRILIVIQALLFMAIAAILLVFSTRLISFYNFSTSLEFLYGRWEVAVAGLVLLLISARLLLSSLKSKTVNETVIQNGEFGAVTMSLVALESLVINTIQDIEDIKDVKVSIKKNDEGVSINLNLVVSIDVVIPEITEELQSMIKSSVENTAGVVVKNIKIRVENVSNQPKHKAAK